MNTSDYYGQPQGAGYAAAGLPVPRTEIARISPVTGKPMTKMSVHSPSGKMIMIDVDETGGVFLDPAELAELAQIEGIVHVLKEKLTHVGPAVASPYQGAGGRGGAY